MQEELSVAGWLISVVLSVTVRILFWGVPDSATLDLHSYRQRNNIFLCIVNFMSTVFNCLWSCFLSWNILKFILPFVLILFLFFSLPPLLFFSLCFLSLYFAPPPPPPLLLLLLLLRPQLMTTNTQMVSPVSLPVSSLCLSRSFSSCRTV